MTKTFAIAAAALAALATPAAARDVPNADIDVSDLDLSQKADQEKLQRRIDTTARRICRMGGFDYAVRKAEQDCRLAVKQSAAREVELAIAKARTERLATIDTDVQG